MAEPVQLELFPAAHPQSRLDWMRVVGEGLNGRLQLELTRNRISMLTVSFEPGGRIKVRAHEGFLYAPGHVLKAFNDYLKRRRNTAWRILTDYAMTIPTGVGRQAPKPGNARGRVYDLEAIRDQVNRRYFKGRLRCSIEWGRERNARRRRGRWRAICFGSYYRDINLVRVHPRLDRMDVPKLFVEYIVFHEMLHALVPERRIGDRSLHHDEEFRRLERTFPGWHAMQAEAQRILATT